MNGSDFAEIFYRDLVKLVDELHAYTDEDQIWKVSPGTTNSGGTLICHLVGSLNHFIGNSLGNTGYKRNREQEFAAIRTDREKLTRSIIDVSDMINDTLTQFTQDELGRIFPLDTFGKNSTTGKVLLILSSHLNYHLGQINYHRRITC